MMAHVDLCSGIGGFALGFEWAELSRPVLFCDIEPWSRKVLAKHWPDVPIAEDVKELANDPTGLVPDCDILSCGYPCQPFSSAGLQRGAEDDRHIWPEIYKIIQAKQPNWIVCENVFGHIRLGLDQVLSDLEAEDYTCQPFVVPACAVNAPHRRDRLWIIAHANSQGQPDGTINEQRMVGNAGCVTKGKSRGGFSEKRINCGTQGQWSDEGHRLADTSEDLADTHSARCQEQWCGEPTQTQYKAAKCGDWWSVEPPVGRVANGISRRVDRLKGLGNAIVPQIAMQIGLTIKAVEDEQTKG